MEGIMNYLDCKTNGIATATATAASAASTNPLDPEEFRRQGYMVIDFIADYLKNVKDYPVRSQVEPGYLRKRLPSSAPFQPESMETILKDVQNDIVPGITHWQSPNHFAYFPSSSSIAGILGETLAAGFDVVGFNWISSPAATELESHVMDWMAEMVNLPECFKFSGGTGGGVLLGTTCEAMLGCVVAARDRALEKIGRDNIDKLVVYASDQTHCSYQKSSQIAGILPRNFRKISTTHSASFGMNPDVFHATVQADIKAGLVPLFLCATVGTTSTAAVDPIRPLCDVANKYGIWVHVDAAYAGPFNRHHPFLFLFVDSLHRLIHFNCLFRFWCEEIKRSENNYHLFDTVIKRTRIERHIAMEDLINAISGNMHVSQDQYDLKALQEYLAATIALPNTLVPSNNLRPHPPSRSASSTRKHLHNSLLPEQTHLHTSASFPSPGMNGSNVGFWNSSEDVSMTTPMGRPGILKRSSSYGFTASKDFVQQTSLNNDTFASFQNDAFAPMYTQPSPDRWAGFQTEKPNPWAGFVGSTNTFGRIPIQQDGISEQVEQVQDRSGNDSPDQDAMDEEWADQSMEMVEDEDSVEDAMGYDQEEDIQVGYGQSQRGRLH